MRQSHRTHLTPETAPRRTPRKSLKIMTISQTHHSTPTSAHSSTTKPARRIKRNRRWRFLMPRSRASLSCFTASVLVVCSWTLRFSASSLTVRTRGLSVWFTRLSRLLSWDLRGDEVAAGKRSMDCWNRYCDLSNPCSSFCAATSNSWSRATRGTDSLGSTELRRNSGGSRTVSARRVISRALIPDDRRRARVLSISRLSGIPESAKALKLRSEILQLRDASDILWLLSLEDDGSGDAFA